MLSLTLEGLEAPDGHGLGGIPTPSFETENGPHRLSVYVDDRDFAEQRAVDLRQGFTAVPKYMQTKWLYDTDGGSLFRAIKGLPDYYLPDRELEIVGTHAADIADLANPTVFVDIGSGISARTRLILGAIAERDQLAGYVPFDIDAAGLAETINAVTTEFDGVPVHAVAGDWDRHLSAIPQGGQRMFGLMASNFGNLLPPDRAVFLANLRSTMRDGDSLLLSTDVVKDPARLVGAYNDPDGVNAGFILHGLDIANGVLGANFDRNNFQHAPEWQPGHNRVATLLRAKTDHEVSLGDGTLIKFDEGEPVFVANHAKFVPGLLRSELKRSGFETLSHWTDPARDLMLTLARPARISTRRTH